MGDDEVRHEPPLAGDDPATLLGPLEPQRATLACTCSGLDAAGMPATVGASWMTLAGLLEHLALVDDGYSARGLHGRPVGAPWHTVDGDADRDREWRTAAADDTPDQRRELADGGLDRTEGLTRPDRRTPSLRTTHVDRVEEYARRADVLREPVDGLTGRSPR